MYENIDDDGCTGCPSISQQSMKAWKSERDDYEWSLNHNQSSYWLNWQLVSSHYTLFYSFLSMHMTCDSKMWPKKLMKNKNIIMPQSLYSPDMDPCVFFIFQPNKKNLKEPLFSNMHEFQIAWQRELNDILRLSSRSISGGERIAGVNAVYVKGTNLRMITLTYINE